MPTVKQKLKNLLASTILIFTALAFVATQPVFADLPVLFGYTDQDGQLVATAFDGFPILFGDADQDGWLASRDMVVIARAALGEQQNENVDLRAANVTGSGNLSEDDVRLLLKALVNDIGLVPLGIRYNALTILPVDLQGEPVHKAMVEIFIDGVKTVRHIQTGVLTLDIPDGSAVRFTVRWENMFYNSPLFTFEHDGGAMVLMVTLGELAISEATLREYATWQFYFNDVDGYVQDNLGLNLQPKFDMLSDWQVSESLVNEARWHIIDQILSAFNESGEIEAFSENAVIKAFGEGENDDEKVYAMFLGGPNDYDYAKSAVLEHSIHMATNSVNRQPHLNLAEEAEYMFVAHYIDVSSPYWETGNIGALLNGPSMVNVLLTNWMTNTDRQNYRLYIDHTGIAETIGSIGDMADYAVSAWETTNDLFKGNKSLGLGQFDTEIATLGYQMGVLRLLEEAGTNAGQALTIATGILADVFGNPSDNAAERLSDLFDRIVIDPNFAELFPSRPTLESVASSLTTILASYLLTGTIGVTPLAIGAMLTKFAFNF